MDISRRNFLAGLSAGVGYLALEPWANAATLPFPELSAKGSPGSIGLAHGKKFAKEVARNRDFYLHWLSDITKVSPKRVKDVAEQFVPVLRNHVPAMLEEIEGIAKGAKLSRAEILTINARTDLLVMARRKVKKAAGYRFESATAMPGCTALALTGRVAGRPHLALGQNWDWRDALAKNIFVMRIEAKGKAPLVTFTEAGMVGKIGFNEHKLGVCLNFLGHKSEDPEGPFGVPVHCMLRAVMEAPSLEAAYKTIAWMPRCASANFLMAQHGADGPQALDLEITPTAVGRIPLSGAGLVHTNHYLDPVLLAGCDSGKGRSTMNRFDVASALTKELQDKIEDPVLRMKKILTNRQGAPYSVAKSSAKDSRSQTLAGVVMDLSRNRLYLAAGEPHVAPFIQRPGV